MAPKPKTPAGKFFAQIGSFWLAVLLLINLFLLTWLGTLEQVEKGINQVQKEYFESWYVFAKAGNWTMPFTDGEKPLTLLLPGGYPTMGLLAISLLVGGLVRIRKSRATIGVIIAHVGIALMLIGGLVEHRLSVYGFVKLEAGESNDQFQEYDGWEVAIWDADATRGVQEFTIPMSHFSDLEGDRTRKFERDELPFDLVLSRFMPNSTPRVAVNVGVPTAPVIDGLFLEETELSVESERNFAGVYATVIAEGGTLVENTFLFGLEEFPWTLSIGGKTWAISLRHAVHPMPYRITLDKFTKDDHPGLEMARAYSSDVTRTLPDGSERKVLIEMNQPLREGGLIVYQASYGPGPGKVGNPYSILAVSRNPSDRIPWVSVSIIAIGLLWTFIDRLLAFLGKEKRRAAKLQASATEKVAA